MLETLQFALSLGSLISYFNSHKTPFIGNVYHFCVKERGFPPKKIVIVLKDECPVDALCVCVFIYLPYMLKNNVEFRKK